MKTQKGLAVLILYGAAGVVSAQSVTYDYTGTVTETVGIAGSLAKGSEVTGTYTFNPGAGIPAQQVGTVGDPNGLWNVAAFGGSKYSLPVPSAFVFSDTLVGGGYSFTSSAAQPQSPFSAVYGYGLSYGGGTAFFQGSYFDNFSNGSSTQSEINLYGAGTLPYNSFGLPVLTTDPDNFSLVETTAAGDSKPTAVQFTVDSLTLVSAPPPAVGAVPELSTFVWMMLGLSLLGFAAHRKKRLSLHEQRARFARF